MPGGDTGTTQKDGTEATAGHKGTHEDTRTKDVDAKKTQKKRAYQERQTRAYKGEENQGRTRRGKQGAYKERETRGVQGEGKEGQDETEAGVQEEGKEPTNRWGRFQYPCLEDRGS